ncbi:hypothetical protein KXV92_009287 [Aspergillus fumigatus]|nr:hypothetical protein KXX57_000383 [Aspergillus fumigatus]KAH2914790.1 hypothetical protein KXW25_009170 [Aspergillus fumigatus]KAH3200620.1 hypothetical protein KXV92_009287 [Aspergillus fumigatus]KAH3201534.1 hypothetical protein KXW62_008858 [Aspergillus fumigatus]KAH3536364.1 hypothetical protein KXV64_009252 [Aspergillus fumigatus]
MAVFAALLLILCVFSGILWNYTRLNTLPGPLLAVLSDIWSQCFKLSPGYAYRLEHLHRKYGEVVRTGPKTVSVSDPSIVFWLDAACPQRSKKSFLDSYVDEPEEAIVNSRLKSDHRIYLDEQTDDGPQHHDEIKNLVLNFLRAIRKQHTMKLTVFRNFATDIVGRMFVGDLGDDRAAPIGTYSRWNDASIVDVLPETGRKTILQAETREYDGPYDSLIVNGADCVAAAFVSMFRHLFKCPTAMFQLQDEVDNAFRNLTISDVLHQETELHALPFLDAVMKESMRLAMKFDYRRAVPAGGLAVLGHYVPERTVVQFHSEALKNNRTTFGEDVSDFRPQRWLQADLDQWQRTRMEEALLFLRPNIPNSAEARAAWLELKRAAALIIWKFDLHPLNYEEVFIQDAVSPEQEYEIMVNFTPRMH